MLVVPHVHSDSYYGLKHTLLVENPWTLLMYIGNPDVKYGYPMLSLKQATNFRVNSII